MNCKDLIRQINQSLTRSISDSRDKRGTVNSRINIVIESFSFPSQESATLPSQKEQSPLTEKQKELKHRITEHLEKTQKQWNKIAWIEPWSKITASPSMKKCQ